MHTDWESRIETALAAVRAATDFTPRVGLVLGSGLGDYAGRITPQLVLPYADIPGLPAATVQGHEGRFVFGEHLGQPVVAMQGRLHSYEGYSQAEVTLPVRLMRRLGVQRLLLTNAAGGTNPDIPTGSLMLLRDHINHSGANPLTGPNLDSFGPRFPDMGDVYTRALREALRERAAAAGIRLYEGVYMMFSGPNYETPAEVRMARLLGADAVGMSTVPEAIVARHCGMEVVGISCITNHAAGIGGGPLSHEEVFATATRVRGTFMQVLDILLREVF